MQLHTEKEEKNMFVYCNYLQKRRKKYIYILGGKKYV